MLSALAAGGRVAIYPDAIAHDPAALLAAAARDRVTVLELVPSLLAAMLEIIEESSEHDLSHLRWLIPTGEALPPELCRRWLARHPAIPLLNAYGPAECADDVSIGLVREAPAEAAWRPAIGRPVANMQLYVVDRDLQPQPMGVPGELCVGGEGVGRGYLGDPVRTALAFVPAPVAGAAAGARLYRTGDLGRWRTAGALEFLGRIDHQVKVRGFRVELGEIEVVLAAHPAVQEAVVDLRGTGTAQRIVAWVTAPGAADPELIASLRSHLQARLPTYMIPAVFAPVAAFPRTPSGKVDRRALPDPELAPAAGTEPATLRTPRTPLEDYLAGLWRQALAVESVGIHDSFFDLGGNSITGAILINRLQRTMGGVIHVVVLFDAPTVAKMAAYLAREQREAVVRLWGAVSLGAEAARAPRAAAGRVDRARLAAFRSLIPPLPPCPDLAAEKNTPVIFILCPPRAGSTLLRVMLGGHPRLFAPPELELLSFNTMADREAAFPGRDSFWLEGAIRAVMEVRQCGVEDARQTIGAAVAEGWTTQRFYRQLQEWLGGRTLVDKTTTYALDLAILRRAEEAFEKPFYIHLIRHPYAAIRSFEEVKLDELFFRHPHELERAELAELIWLASHQNILEHLAGVPAERQIRVHFEDLVRHPEAELRQLCAALGVELHPAMIDPYQEGPARMTDGIHAEGKMLGDVKFLQYKGVEAGVAERFREAREDSLGAPTWEMAASLGYDRPAPPPPAAIPRAGGGGEPRPLSFAQQRLWFLAQLEPDSPLYNLPVALRIAGPLDPRVLAATLGEMVRRHEALRTVLAAPEGSPVQVIQPAEAFLLPVVDLSGLPRREREAQALTLAGEEAGRPFDLARGPLLRGSLLRLAAGDHAVALTMHHIASDGWSLGILVREVTALYAAFAAGRPSPLPELPVQYSDFAVWQRSWLQGEVLEQEISFWRQELAGLPPLLNLPTDRPRPARQSFRGSARPVRLPAGLTRRLEALARREGATLFMALLAGFQALLARTSGQDDLAVGSPTAGRNRVELEGLIGFFVNTLVLRGDLSAGRAGGPSFRELLGRVRKTSLSASRHQDVPFEKLVEELSPRRSLAHAPLFQVMFVLQNAPVESLEIRDLQMQRLGGAGTMARFDLTLSLGEHDGELAGRLEYATDLFDAATIDRLIGHYERLLGAAVAGPELEVTELPLLSGAERHQLLLEWSDSAAPFPREATVHRLFAEQAELRPAAVAVEQGEERLTYGELQQRAERIARRLVARGLRLEEPVAVFAERSPDLIAALLGILAAGGAYLPLDPSYPPERLAFMVADAGASLLVQLPARSARSARSEPGLELPPGLRPVTLDGEEPAVELPPVPAEALAYVLYTSGSTGVPKGVAVTHRNVVRLVRGAGHADMGADHTWLQYAPVSFDISTLEIWAPLLNGGRLVLFPERMELFDAWAQVVETHGVTSATLTAGLFHEMLDRRPAFLRPLTQFVTGGEAVSAEHARRALAAHPGLTLIDGYGPTEGTTFTSCHRMTDPDQVGESVPIGRPIANARACVLDGSLAPVPVGVWGELYAGGAGLARGYLGGPALTAASFIPDPFAAVPGERLYRTGDVVRWRADGVLEFSGRTDTQVKLRGFRVELGEIEAALAALAGVREAVVAAREDTPGDQRLVAYVVGEVEVAALRRSLQERLPGYMVPAAFVLLAALPLTPNGKVDRQALPAPDRQRAEEGYRSPRTPVEELLAGIWAELLGVERVGASSNFFDLGGHSLLAVRVMGRIEHVFGVTVPISALFEAPTVEQLAGMIQERRVPRSAPLVRLHSGGAGRPLFLAPPVGGNVFSYVSLAKKLGAKRPVYGLQAIGEGIGPPPSMEDLAAQYLATVREVQAEGPWLLGAWSAGAVTAYEMARQIESTGGTALLTMFDPPAPPDGCIKAVGDTELLLAFARMASPSAEQKALIHELVEGLDVEAGLDRLLELARAEGVLTQDVGKPWLRERFNLYCRSMTTVEGYQPRPYGGRLILFRADGLMAPGAVDLIWGWDRLARTEAHLIVDADHASLLQEPALDQLVEHLESALAAVEGGT
jgi:amino acid adenylation domain-containing protein